MKDKSEQEIGDRVTRLESWAHRSAYAVIVGLVVETGLAIYNHSGKTFWENWAPVISDILVAGGVAGEVLFGRWVGQLREELQHRSEAKLVEANERAKVAELETEKLRSVVSWRRLSSEHIAAISKILTVEPKGSLTVTYVNGDPEINTFAHDIGSVFRQNGWRVGYTAATYPGEIAFGLRLPIGEENDLQAVATARRALNNAGIEFTGHGHPRWIMGAGSGEAVESPCAHLYVGPKPIISMESSGTTEGTATMDPEEAQLTEQWRSRLQGDEPIITWPITDPLTIAREDDGTIIIDCRTFALAGIDGVGIMRFRISPEAAKELSEYLSSLENADKEE